MGSVRIRVVPAVLAVLTIAGLSWLLPGARPPTPTFAADGLFTWAERAPVSVARAEAQGLAVGTKLYVLGGFFTKLYEATTRCDVYDPATNVWTQIADMPQPLTHSAQASDGEVIYVVGGYLGTAPGPATTAFLLYNIASNTWSAGPALPAPRGGGTAAIVGRQLHYFGGALRVAKFDDADQPEHFVFNLDTGTWKTAAPIPFPRNHLGSAVLKRKIYVIGGQLNAEEDSTSQARVDVYDPATDTWARAADLPIGRSHISASVLTVDGSLVVIGGATDGPGGVASSDVFMYDPQLDAWARMTALPGRRKSLVAGYINGALIAGAGGTGDPSTQLWSAQRPNTWEILQPMPVALGEVAGGIISRTLYLVGEGNRATLAYDLGLNTWRSTVPERPFPGNHHAAEVLANKLYLFGGLGGDANGKVQIYDPQQNAWSAGATMPFAAGSSSTAVIDGRVYLAGGIVDDSTTTQAAVYDPAADQWQPIAPMPQGRNHAAAATDGARLYVFGGRGPGSGDGNTVANGFNTVQIYDPLTNSWQSSDTPGSTIAPLPIGRGGMGRAIYSDGRFYIFGGETASEPSATADRVYSRVDVYDPVANSWSTMAPMPTARHGIFPMRIGWRIYLAGGGAKAGFAQSNLLEVFNVPVFTKDPAPVDPRPTPTITRLPMITITRTTTSHVPTATITVTTTSPPATPTKPIYLPRV